MNRARQRLRDERGAVLVAGLLLTLAVLIVIGAAVDIVLNDKPVIENAQLPGIPRRGPIGLQHHGDPIEFANLFIRELD